MIGSVHKGDRSNYELLITCLTIENGFGYEANGSVAERSQYTTDREPINSMNVETKKIQATDLIVQDEAELNATTGKEVKKP